MPSSLLLILTVRVLQHMPLVSLLCGSCCRERGVETRCACARVSGTLVDTKSGAKFAQNASDWRWLFPEVPTVLQSYHEKGALVCVASSCASSVTSVTAVADVVWLRCCVMCDVYFLPLLPARQA